MQVEKHKKFRLSRKQLKLFLQEEENVQALKDAYNNGIPWHMIEGHFGISRSKCQNILKENGCTMIRNKKGVNRIFYCKEKVQALKEAFEQGMSWDEIGEKFQASPSTCMRVLKNLGIDIRRGKKFFDDKEKFEILKKAYESGLSWLDIESIFQFQISSKTCMNALKDAGYSLRKKR